MRTNILPTNIIFAITLHQRTSVACSSVITRYFPCLAFLLAVLYFPSHLYCIFPLTCACSPTGMLFLTCTFSHLCHLPAITTPPHYRKRGSASYIVREVLSVREREREREIQRERDGSDVTIVALKLAMNLHFPLPKIRTIGDELTLSLAKTSHFRFSLHTSRLSLHGEVTIVAQ